MPTGPVARPRPQQKKDAPPPKRRAGRRRTAMADLGWGLTAQGLPGGEGPCAGLPLHTAPSRPQKGPGRDGQWIKRLFPLEALAVGALIHGGMGLMGSHLDLVQRAVVVAVAVVRTGPDGAGNAVVGMFHSLYPPFCGPQDPAQGALGLGRWSFCTRQVPPCSAPPRTSNSMPHARGEYTTTFCKR